jgi:serine protease Do
MQGVPQGALIVGVDPGSPADRADLSPGMVIVEAGGKPIKNPRELAQVVKGARSGTVMLLRIQVPEGGRLLRAITIP